MHGDCGCGPDFRRPKDNGTCATCGGWLPGERPPSLTAMWARESGPFERASVPPPPDRVDWQAALRALYDACYRTPLKSGRTPEEQRAVECFTTRMLQVSRLLSGYSPSDCGMLGIPVPDDCDPMEFIRKATDAR